MRDEAARGRENAERAAKRQLGVKLEEQTNYLQSCAYKLGYEMAAGFRIESKKVGHCNEAGRHKERSPVAALRTARANIEARSNYFNQCD